LATPTDGNDPTFGQWLKRRRRGLGLTQRSLDHQVRWAGETIRKFEADDLRPSHQLAERPADALHLEPGGRVRFVLYRPIKRFRPAVNEPPPGPASSLAFHNKTGCVSPV
jgi:hypothetical protein